MASVAFIHKTGGSIVVFIDGKSHIVDPSALNYQLVVKALQDNDHESLVSLLNIRKVIADYSNGLVEVCGDSVYYDKKLIRGELSERIIYMFKQNLLIEPYVKFMEKVQKNPLDSAKEELFLFMESNNLPITPDGDFLAYKAIARSHDQSIDWTDNRTNTISNRIGNVVEMNREDVNPNRHETCSSGLHVCSYSYLGSYYSPSSSRLVAVKINPMDVVSIPSDYNNAKMRVCRYVVVDEIESWGDDIPKNYTDKYNDSYGEYYEDDGDGEYYEDDGDGEYYEDDGDGEYYEDDGDGEDGLEIEPKSSSSKLTPDKVREIRSWLEQGWSLASIAREYNISPRQVARIRDGEAWADVV